MEKERGIAPNSFLKLPGRSQTFRTSAGRARKALIRDLGSESRRLPTWDLFSTVSLVSRLTSHFSRLRTKDLGLMCHDIVYTEKCHDLRLRTWDLGLGTLDFGLRTQDSGLRTITHHSSLITHHSSLCF